MGTLLGGLFHRLARRRGRIIRFNLGLAYPELKLRERERLALDVGRHFGRALLATLRIQRMRPEKLLRLVKVEGQEHLDAVVQGARGAFFLSAHLGAWEVAALYLGLTLPGGFGVVHRPLDNPLLESELEDFRRQFGNRMLGKKAVLRAILGEIKAGQPVGILIDQKTRSRDGGVDVPFFGHPAKTHPILARVVLKTDTPVIPVFAYAERGGRFTLSFGPPVPVEAQDDVISLTARYTAVTEEAIRRRPEQWLWYHDRWRELRLASESSS
ncbi:MAG: lysophospholipid acyltransferase family protein [Thermoanaerobaculales bacterium]|nr:lysophospholipid acyltransferase family protein [Thermoanaerobaculales bacterium]